MDRASGLPEKEGQSNFPLPSRLLFSLLIITSVLATALPVSAAEYTISPDDLIQDAIDAADSGDTIILNPGTYHQNGMTVPKDISIRANTSFGGNPSNTIIDGMGSGRIFYSGSGHSLAIDNLTLQNGRSAMGGAILNGEIYTPGATYTITSSIISNCSADLDNGGAIHIAYGNLTIISTTFSNCSAKYYGGAVAVYDSTVTITSSLFTSCSAINGGAVEGYNSTITINSSTFSDCSASLGGGAVRFLMGGTNIVISSTFSNCSAENGGAMNIDYGSSADIISSSFSQCSANRGGAIWSGSGTINITSSTFSTCSAIDGGAIFAGNGITVTSSSFSHCSATSGGRGGAIVSDSGTVNVTSTSFSDCSATIIGGAIESNKILTVTSSTFSNCSAVSGGAIISVYHPVTVTNSTFSNCSAQWGGAIEIYSGTVNVTASLFSTCSATTPHGGAINSRDSTITILSSSFSNSSAVSGGVIYSDSSSTTIRFSRIYNNTGIAVYNTAGGTVDAANNWWSTNDDPSGLTSGGVTVSPWLVLNISATPSSITPAHTSAIRITLTNNSAGTDTMSGGIFVPDGIPVAFEPTSGTGSLAPQAGTITSGANTTAFTPAGAGTSTVSATVDGQTVDVNIISTISVIPVPGFPQPPTDPDHDGIYEDLNGNTRLDFADVVLYFNQMTWIAANEPITAFDLNGNGRIDFADIVALFNEI
jgi:PKD repeat protein